MGFSPPQAGIERPAPDRKMGFMNEAITVYLERLEFGLIRIQGKDALDYLHRQLSNEIRSLRPGEGAPVCYLNAQGRIRLFFNLYRSPDEEGFLALIAGDQRSSFIPELERLVFREQIEFTDLSSDFSSIVLTGSHSEGLLGEILNEPAVPEMNSVRELGGDRGGLFLFQTDWTCEPTFLLSGPRAMVESLVAALQSTGTASMAPEDFHTLRIEKGTPWPGFEVGDSMIPYECGLEGAVSLTKGCYVGQEVIARMANLGAPPRLLRGLLIEAGSEAVPELGAVVASGEVLVGEILTSGWSDRLGSVVALSSIRKKFSIPGTGLSVEGKPATVKTFPMQREDE